MQIYGTSIVITPIIIVSGYIIVNMASDVVCCSITGCKDIVFVIGSHICALVQALLLVLCSLKMHSPDLDFR